MLTKEEVLKIKNKIQDKIVNDFFNKYNTNLLLEIYTGFGKGVVATKIISKFNKNHKILFLSETTVRETTFKKELEEFKVTGYDITFMCYQSAYKMTNTFWDLVIADEIHESCSEEYFKFYLNNNYKSIIGLTATLPAEKREYTNQIFKHNFKFSIKEGKSLGLLPKYNFYIINHKLDNVEKNIQAGNKLKVFYQTELAMYKYLDSVFAKSLFVNGPNKDFIIRNAAAKRSNFLYNLPSKTKEVKKLVNAIINSRKIIFGTSINSLLEITSEVVSSKNTPIQNTKILDNFNNKIINTIGSFKMLLQGANLKDINVAILHSYYGKEKQFIQSIGRILRFEEEKIADIIIFRTLGTQEEKWFNTMTEGTELVNKRVFDNVDEFLNFYNK